MGSAASKPEHASPAQPQASEKGAAVREMTRELAGLRLGAQPASSDGSVSAANISQWEQDIPPTVELARTILNHTNVKDALVNRKAVVADQHVFNTEVSFKTGPITNQKSSGRGWLFATTNVLRYNVMKKFNLEDFQLSQVCGSFLEW